MLGIVSTAALSCETDTLSSLGLSFSRGRDIGYLLQRTLMLEAEICPLLHLLYVLEL